MDHIYTQETNNIVVTVRPNYIEDQSNPAENHYVFSYHVKIENRGDKPVQLKSRYWKITNGFGRQEELEGEGVVGLQPTIQPGESFEYSSGAPLSTNTGIMMGKYKMVSNQGNPFDVIIPAFSLHTADAQQLN